MITAVASNLPRQPLTKSSLWIFQKEVLNPWVKQWMTVFNSEQHFVLLRRSVKCDSPYAEGGDDRFIQELHGD
jgi:hypothetical protein